MYRNKDFFTEKYLELDKNIERVAEYFGISRSCAFRYAKKYEITNGKKTTRHSVDIDYFKTIDTEEKAYWLGFIMADGCIYKGDSKNSYIFQINLALKDKNQLERLNKAIKSDYEIKEHDVILGDSIHKTATLVVSKSEFCKHLIQHGIVQRKSYCAKLPNLDKNLYKHFIRGLFDGDGSVSFYNRNESIRTTFNIVGNFDILNSIKQLFQELNIKTNIYKTHSQTTNSLETASRKEALKIYHYLYDSSSIFLKRKKDIFDKILLYTCPSI